MEGEGEGDGVGKVGKWAEERGSVEQQSKTQYARHETPSQMPKNAYGQVIGYNRTTTWINRKEIKLAIRFEFNSSARATNCPGKCIAISGDALAAASTAIPSPANNVAAIFISACF